MSAKKILEGFTIYGHGINLDHVIKFIYNHFGSPFIKMLFIKYESDCPSGFRIDDLCILWLFTCIMPRGRGRPSPVGPNSFQNRESPVNSPISCKFCS